MNYMKKFKLICLLLLVCNLPALAQNPTKKTSEKVKCNTFSKSNNPDDSLKKEDPLQIQLDQIKKDIAEINAKILPAESTQPYKDTIITLEIENKNLKDSQNVLNSEIRNKQGIIDQLIKDTETEKNKQIRLYTSMANSIIRTGSIVPNELLDTLLNHTAPNDKLELFKTQSIDLKFVQDLLNNSVISVEDYNKAKAIMSKPIKNEYVEQAKLFTTIKSNFDSFNKFGKNLSNLLIDIAGITDITYRKNKFDGDFPSKEGCNFFPYLKNKLDNAYTKPSTKIDLLIP